MILAGFRHAVVKRHTLPPLALVVALLLAGGVGLQAQRLPVRAYTTADGLLHNTVNRIVKDSRGLLWFCTNEGLSRFDGYAFVNFGVEQGGPAAAVTDLLETRGGEYLGGNRRRPVSLRPRGKLFQRRPGRVEPSNPGVTVLLEDHDKTIWSGTRTGLYRLEQSEPQPVLQHIEIGMPDTPADRVIADLLEDSRHSPWIAATSGLYRRWPDGSTARYTERDGLPASNVSDLLEDREGHLWAATRAGGFFRFSADDSHRAPTIDHRFSRTDGLSVGLGVSNLETSDGRFWSRPPWACRSSFRTALNGAAAFGRYGDRNGLPRQIRTLAEDCGGNLWTGSRTAGAARLAQGGFVTYGEPEGISIVSAVFEDESGNLCFRGRVPGTPQTGASDRPGGDVLGADPVAPVARLGCFYGQRFDWFRPFAVTEAGWRRSGHERRHGADRQR